ncbi:bifunctional 3-(3-hydroxy-phenyl)propionate/3-hydroxycinnamic acid hydroxylase [Kribbella sp. NPDC056345]|uniref:bifunctional 3-(3-hydroxy-phenyl)propionate/3-hydroxycinnamic acid hydroxylase MhpA n=1 Tax=Kribbella sp. NPDC056345 TaxID=3345789 RepID=UPI0035D5DB27
MTGRVIVVGAGPTGVAVATLLASYGVEVLVLERWAEVYSQPRAVHLDDEVYRILGWVGVAREFARISRPTLGLRLVDGQHRTIAEFRRHERTGRHGYPEANLFDQPDLEVLLRANLANCPSVTFQSDVEVTAVRQLTADAVQVDLHDRTTGQVETLTASYVLGCDGANSLVRRAIGARFRDLGFDQRWLVVDLDIDQELGHWDGVHQLCDTGRAATYLRVGARRHRWEFRLADDEDQEDFRTPGALRSIIGPWLRAADDDRIDIVRVASYTFRAQVADRWRDRRIFLLGDAAHLTPPFIGQGLGAGMRDAANLSWKLAGVLDARLPEQVLDTYQQERRPHAIHMIRLAKAVGAIMTNGGRTGDVLRRLIAPRLSLVPGLAARVLSSETPRLTRTGLVRRSRWSGGVVGTLCANAPVGIEQRLDDHAAGRFALLTTQHLTAFQRAEAVALGVVVLETKPRDRLHHWLTQGRRTSALIRPDSIVMLAADTVDDVLLAASAVIRRRRLVAVP